jgi:hypothetical protein
MPPSVSDPNRSDKHQTLPSLFASLLPAIERLIDAAADERRAAAKASRDRRELKEGLRQLRRRRSGDRRHPRRALLGCEGPPACRAEVARWTPHRPDPGCLTRPPRRTPMRQGRSDGLVFGRTAELPLDSRALVRRAATAWKRAKLAPIGLHECRHTYASLMIAAGVNGRRSRRTSGTRPSRSRWTATGT